MALDDVVAALGGLTTVLFGSSGVGKSTLMNRLTTGGQRTGVMSGVGKGRHTTSAAQAIALPGGGWVIDTPGVRSFGLGAFCPKTRCALKRHAHTHGSGHPAGRDEVPDPWGGSDHDAPVPRSALWRTDSPMSRPEPLWRSPGAVGVRCSAVRSCEGCPWPVSSPRFWPREVRTSRGDV
ncbi:MAG: GTPase RsgA [Mycobacteriales bacterium]